LTLRSDELPGPTGPKDVLGRIDGGVSLDRPIAPIDRANRRQFDEVVHMVGC
jgi:hypothetical protein